MVTVEKLTIEQLLLLLTFIMAAIYVSVSILRTSKLKKKIKSLQIKNKDFLMTKPPMTYDECKDIVDTCVGNVLMDLELRYKLNDVVYIKNMDKETTTATLDVMDLVSENVIEQMQCYVSRTYIIQYISRNVRNFLIAYLKEKNKGV